MKSYHLSIKGRVQRVFYRESAKREANRLGVTGWVKNKPDGSVELLACGKEDTVQKLVEWCKTGPPLAKVTEVTIPEVELQSFTTFTVER